MNYRKIPWWGYVAAAGIVIGVLALITGANYRFAENSRGGGEFLVHWLGIRSYLLKGVNPYSDAALQEARLFAQQMGNITTYREPRMISPLYAIVVYLPFSLIENFEWARAAWMTFQECLLVGLAVLCIQLSGWKPRRLVYGAFLVFSIFWYHGFSPVMHGDSVVIAAFFIAAGLFALNSNSEEMAGVLFAFSTIQPFYSGVFFLFLVYWAVRNERWRLLSWLVVTIVLLGASAALLMPDWVLQCLRAVVSTYKASQFYSPADIVSKWLPGMGARIGWIFSGAIGLLLILEWHISLRKSGKAFLWTACLTLAASQWVGLKSTADSFVLMLPGLALFFSMLQNRWERKAELYSLASMGTLLVFLWGMAIISTQQVEPAMRAAMVFFPFPLVLLLLLYWVRWWILRPAVVWFDEFPFDERINQP